MLALEKADALDFGNPRPLTWHPSSVGTRRRSALATCGSGHMGSLIDHVIDDEGAVSPSVYCPLCGWGGDLKLIGWSSLPS